MSHKEHQVVIENQTLLVFNLITLTITITFKQFITSSVTIPLAALIGPSPTST